MDRTGAKSMFEVVKSKFDHQRAKLIMRRRMMRRLVFGLFLADLMSSGSLWIFTSARLIATDGTLVDSDDSSHLPNDWLCNTQAIVQQIASVLQMLYVLSMAAFMGGSLVLRNLRALFAFEMVLHCVAWVLALASGIIPLVLDLTAEDVPAIHLHFEDTGTGWCWLSVKPVWGRFVFFYVWAWSSVLVLMLVYGVVMVYVLRKARTAQAMRRRFGAMPLSWSVRRLWVFPLGYLVVWLLPSANRISDAVHGPIFVLALAEAISVAMQGSVDAFLYGSTTIIPEMIDLRRDNFSDLHLFAYMDQDQLADDVRAPVGSSPKPISTSIDPWSDRLAASLQDTMHTNVTNPLRSTGRSASRSHSAAVLDRENDFVMSAPYAGSFHQKFPPTKPNNPLYDRDDNYENSDDAYDNSYYGSFSALGSSGSGFGGNGNTLP